MSSEVMDYVLAPIVWISWILSLPIRGITWIVVKIRTKKYDPEKVPCPGCGYQGEEGSNWKTCNIQHAKTEGPERAANKHICLRCSAGYFTALVVPADKWIGKTYETELARLKKQVEAR